MPRAGDVNHVEIILFNDSIQMGVNEVLAWSRSPMSQEHVLHVG